MGSAEGRPLAAWWPLVGLTALAAALRLSTLGLQSFWYDEAYTPVHVLHPSLWATLHSVVHSENTPPLWYVLIWGWAKVLGNGTIALRSLSALAGIATVPVGWEIGRMLAGRRAAIATAALLAVNPLFIWYSQEARAYELFVLASAVAILCFLRAEQRPTPRRLAAFALSGVMALLTHYFAVFLLIPMSLWLLRRRERWRVVAPAVLAIGLAGLALLPLLSAQGGHGTQWIGRWALSSRLQAIPQYYLTGYSGAPLGHGIELLVALAILAGVAYGLWRTLTPAESDGALLMLGLTVCAVLVPVALVAVGADYLAPRNLVAAMVPLSAFIAVVSAARRTGRTGMALVALISLLSLAISIDVNLSPRLQRGDWSGVARALGGAAAHGRSAATGRRAIVTVELGSAPLEYYMGPLTSLPSGASTAVSEIDEVGYAPLRSPRVLPPAAGFQLFQRSDVDGLIVYRFRAARPHELSERALRRQGITEARTEVLVPGGPALASSLALAPSIREKI